MTHEEAIYTLKNAAWLAVSDGPYLAKVEEAIDVLNDAKPVRHGRWKCNNMKTLSFNRTECNAFAPYGVRTRYCPWCGAIMEEQE